MAHIVCITGGLTGILNASLELAQRLIQAGHRVTYGSPGNLRDPVTAQGISYVQLDRWVIQSGDPPMSQWSQLRSLRERRQRAVDALGVQCFAPMMHALSPDLLLIDIEMHPHIMAAVMGQLPVALLCPFLSIWKRPHLPPIHTDIAPGIGWRGHWLGLEWSWLRYGWAKWTEAQRECWRRMGLDWGSVLRCYARQIGYPFQARIGFRQWLTPFPDRDLPILCLNALELDFPHNPNPSMHYLGPMVSSNAQTSHLDTATNQILEQIFERRRSSGRSLIYCGCSSLAKADQRFLKLILAAASKSPQWDWIVGLGGKLEPDQLGVLPFNLQAFGWAPQTQVLNQADCAVINSGINSINECINSGIPMLVYSLRRADQNGNAARIAYYGLGIVGDREQTDAAQVCRHIQTLLSDPSYSAHVNQMRDRFRRYDQENRAINIIESLLNTQSQKLQRVRRKIPIP